MSVLEYEVSQARLVEFKSSGTPRGTALFSRYFVEDSDHDYTKPGFLPKGAVVPLLIGHQWKDVPVGKGRIRSERDGGYYDFELANTHAGQELAEWLRHDLDSYEGPVSEWSYGFTPFPDATSRELVDGKSVRVLHARADGSFGAIVHECSYGLRGSGVGTQLIAMKSAEQAHWRRLHAKLTAQVNAQHAAEQREMQALYERFLARQKRMARYE